MRERKRSSERRMVASACSFCSMVAPAIRMTNNRMNALIRARALAWLWERNDGAMPCQMAICPTVMPSRLHSAVTRHTWDPSWATFSRARKANAPHRTGPQPLR